ncbi:hypothetical protein PGTUg99_013703 [Puccinia graminis f. sp. tritici]|uniref:Uncharacterized protein n=1 Tax=Puccinia graminis f. sp. tritici TaxID=56615 RepID=A0A5B0Q495_PUCGR|nr:hypothetical protein PGTUg99_013703 [Puccinia graminis f. sp. tritici]
MKKQLSRLIKNQLKLNKTLKTKNNNNLLTTTTTSKPNTISFIGSKLANTINSITNNNWTNLDIKHTHTNWKTNPLRTTTTTTTEQHPLNAQLIIIVFDPITEYHLLKQQLTLIKNIHQPLLILLDSPIPANLLKPILFQNEPFLALNHNNTIFFIDSQAALDAIHHFDHDNQAAIDRIRNSGLLELRQAIHTALQPRPPSSSAQQKDPPNRLRPALSLAELALDLAEEKVLSIVEETQTASARLAQYHRRLQRLQNLARSVQGPGSSEPSSLKKLLISRLGFFRSLFSSDLVGTRASVLLDQLYLDQTEKNIIKQKADEVIGELLRDPILARYRTETMVNDVLRSRATDHDLFLLDQQHDVSSEREKGKTQMGSIRLFEQHKTRLLGPGGPVQALQTKATRMSANTVFMGLGIAALSLASHPPLLLLLPTLPSPLPSLPSPALPAFLAVSALWFAQKSWSKSLHSFVQDLDRWNHNLHHHLLEYQQRVGERIFLLSTSSSSSSTTTTVTASEPTGTTTASKIGNHPSSNQEDQVQQQDVDLIQAIRDNIHARLNVPVVETDQEDEDDKDDDDEDEDDDDEQDDDDDDGTLDSKPSGTSSTVNLLEWVRQLRRQLESLKPDLSPPPPPSSSSSSSSSSCYDQPKKSSQQTG